MSKCSADNEAGETPIGAGSITSGGDLYSDDETFVVAGVPALSLEVVPSDYDNRAAYVISCKYMREFV